MSQSILNKTAVKKCITSYNNGEYSQALATMCNGDIDRTVEFFDLKNNFNNLADVFKAYLEKYGIESELITMKNNKILKKPKVLEEEIEHIENDNYINIQEELKEYANELNKNGNTVGVIIYDEDENMTIDYFKSMQDACHYVMKHYGVKYKENTVELES